MRTKHLHKRSVLLALGLFSTAALFAQEVFDASGVVASVDSGVIALGAAPSAQLFVLGTTTAMEDHLIDNPETLVGQRVNLRYTPMDSLNYVTELSLSN